MNYNVSMKLTKTVFCLTTLLALAATSCIREDLDECLSKNRLLLSYKGDGTTEIFPDKICRVEMFVFDAGNRCVNSSLLSQQEVATRTATLPPLEAGDYRIVCLGNTHDTRTDGTASGDYDRMIFAAADYFDRKTVSGNDSLYYASTSYTVLPYGTGREEANRTQVIEFASAHYDLLVEVAGIPDPNEQRAGALPTLKICGVKPCTDFENRACGEPTDYLLETQYEAGLLSARANIMRHKNHEDVNLRLYAPAGDLLAEVNFAEFLAAHPVIDCSKHEVLIPIRIEFKSGQISIGLPDWYIEQVEPEF